MTRVTLRRIVWPIVALTASAWINGCTLRAFSAQRRTPAPPTLGKQVERAARALTGNALLVTLGPAELGNRLKEAYNRAAPTDWPKFTPDLMSSLALYDGFDGRRGNQWLAVPNGTPGRQYQRLATLLADDRIWVNSASTTCTRYFAVELDALATPPVANVDCGGRTPNYDAVDVFRSLLVNGTTYGAEDGVVSDDRIHSTTKFPFLAAP